MVKCFLSASDARRGCHTQWPDHTCSFSTSMRWDTSSVVHTRRSRPGLAAALGRWTLRCLLESNFWRLAA